MCMGLTDGRQASELARIRRRAESAILVSDKPNEAELTWQGQAQNPACPPHFPQYNENLMVGWTNQFTHLQT